MAANEAGETQRGRPALFVGLVAALWLTLAVLEIYHLFDPFTYPYPPGRRPLGHPTPYLRSVHRTLDGDQGGDLTRMLGFRLTGIFAAPRGHIEVHTDRRGYRNEPRLADTHCPVAVTGDSFMDQGLTNADTPAGQLGRLMEAHVYDHTYMGRGPSTGIQLLLDDTELRRDPPKVIVWGFVERSIHPKKFPGYQPPRPKPSATLPERLAAVWDAIRLPDTDRRSYRYQWKRYTGSAKWSLLRACAVTLRAETTWRLTGRFLTDTVLLGKRPDGGFALFLSASLRSLARSARQRGLSKVAAAIISVHAECRRRGIHLVVLLIPDKAHVYTDWLPPDRRPPIPRPNALDDLEARLTRRSLHVVNLLPVFRAAKQRDSRTELLYYPDDTHWTERGIRLAMEAIADSLRNRGIRLGN